MTDQPRDLAAEVDGIDLAEEHRRIRRDHEHWYHPNCMYEAPQFEWQTHEVSIHRLLEYITALSRELEEHREALRWATAERDEARRKCKTLEDESVEKQSALTNWRDTAFRMSSKHAAAERRIERLEGALRKISEQLPTVPSAALVVGYKSQQLALRALTASQQHTAGSGDGVAGD